MSDPFALLGIDEHADDETVRRAYLNMVRIYSPERDPVRFQEIRQAYESLAHAADRMGHHLFMAHKPDPLPLVATWLRAEQQSPSPDGKGLISLLSESLQQYRLPTPDGKQ